MLNTINILIRSKFKKKQFKYDFTKQLFLYLTLILHRPTLTVEGVCWYLPVLQLYPQSLSLSDRGKNT